MIFFDLDDTLLDHSAAKQLAAGEFYRHFASDIGCSLADFLALWRRLSEKYVNRYLRGELTWEEQQRARIREVFRDSKPRLSDSEADARFSVYLQAYEQSWVPFADVEPCLEALRGHELGIITNGTVDQQTRKLERLGIRGRFRVIVISEAVGAAKPDPEIFKEACRLAGRPPRECAYVGDRLETDARASKAAGMRGIWIDRAGKSDARQLDVEVIRSLVELPALILPSQS